VRLTNDAASPRPAGDAHVTTAWIPSARTGTKLIGFNYRMTNLQAAIGVAQMTRIEGFNHEEARAGSAGTPKRWRRWPPPAPDPASGAGVGGVVFWMNSVLLADVRASVDEVRARLLDRGIDSRPFFHPSHTLPP